MFILFVTAVSEYQPSSEHSASASDSLIEEVDCQKNTVYFLTGIGRQIYANSRRQNS
jgi:hypothetical protein